jgi:hypothetical protein
MQDEKLSKKWNLMRRLRRSPAGNTKIDSGAL